MVDGIKLKRVSQSGRDLEMEYELEDEYESIETSLLEGKSSVDPGKMGIFATALFIVGEMTGSGILGVPQALAYSGYSGFALMFLCVAVATYTGLTLSRNWMHVRDQYPRCAKPYQCIGNSAFGKCGEVAVQVCANVTLVGGCCAYILIAAQSLSRFLFIEFEVDCIGYRTCVAIMALVFLVVILFGSGGDSLLVPVLATVLSVTFTLLIIYGIFQTGKSPNFQPYQVTAKSWFLSFGKFLFAFGGHSAFPNFQKEMKKPRDFPGSVIIAFLIKLVLYIPVGITGMLFFGDCVKPNILHNIDPQFKALNACILLLVAVQAIMSATILGNPVAAMIEGAIGAPHKQLFSAKRVAVRIGYVAVAIVVCEAIPRFDLIMALIGGTTINTAVFILPSLFHIKLAKKDKWLTFKKTLDALSITFGMGAGIVCTYASVSHIVDEMNIHTATFNS
ncbi:uncharacterized protein LOC134822314 isoform X2 [Bolinopsis microptera]|uniref:uncharacterized protein LOC134822314 isoform X2 n=1 Tax=Bolinopsis microptera TaxID=2820187 RepID=UPI003078E30C